MTRHNPPTPAPHSVEIEPYTGPVVSVQKYIGPRETVFEQVLEAFTTGQIRRYDPPEEIEPGKVLVIGYPVPAQPPAPEPEQAPVGKRSRFAEWPIYYWAALAPFALAVLGVLVVLFIAGLRAVVVWGMANALLIGGVVLVSFLAVLVFLGALAKARHGYHGGGYPRRW